MYMLRGSVAGRLVGVVAAGIKCRPYLDSRLTTQMVKLVTSRSLGNCMASDSPVDHLKMDNTSRQSEIDVPSFFTEMNTQKNTVPIRNPKIDNSCRRKKQIDFPEFFTKINAQMKKHHHKKRIYGQMDDDEKLRIYGPVFTGVVEMRYLEYLDKLPDWNSVQKHVVDYPRRRSKNEKRLIYEKWASHYGRKYPSAEMKERRYTCFTYTLDFIDERHSKDTRLTLCLSRASDLLPVKKFISKWDGECWVGNRKIMDGKKNIYFPTFFTKMKALPKPDHRMKRIYGPVFTGEVEKRYLEYLKKLDWESLHKHIRDFPRRRSRDEKWLLFDKWAAHYGRLFPSDADYVEAGGQIEENEYGYTHDENKYFLFQHFKHRLKYIDNVNSKQHQEGLTLGLDADAVPDHEDIESLRIPDETVYTYWVDLLFIPYTSITPPIFCELIGTVDTLKLHYGIEVCYPL